MILLSTGARNKPRDRFRALLTTSTDTALIHPHLQYRNGTCPFRPSSRTGDQPGGCFFLEQWRTMEFVSSKGHVFINRTPGWVQLRINNVMTSLKPYLGIMAQTYFGHYLAQIISKIIFLKYYEAPYHYASNECSTAIYR